MKRCPTCNRSYGDEELNFCLDDGSRLNRFTGEQTRHYSPRSTDPLATEVLPTGQQHPASPNIFDSGGLLQPEVAQRKYHGLAITSFILGLIPCTCIPSVLAVVFGHIALSKIKAAPNLYRGRLLALWGTGLGYFFTVCNIIYGIVMSVIDAQKK